MQQGYMRAIGLGLVALLMGLVVVHAGSPPVDYTSKYKRQVRKLTKKNHKLAQLLSKADANIVNNPTTAGSFKKHANPESPVALARKAYETEHGLQVIPYEKKLMRQQWILSYGITEGGTIVFYYFDDHRGTYGL